MKSSQEQKELWNMFEKMGIIKQETRNGITTGFKITTPLKTQLMFHLNQNKSPMDTIIHSVRDVSGPNITQAEWEKATNFLIKFLADYMPNIFGHLSSYRSEELNPRNG